MPDLLLCPTCLVLYELSCHMCLVSYVLHVPRAIRTSVLDVVRGLRAPVPHMPRAIVPLCLMCFACSRASRAIVSQVSYIPFYLTCLVSCVFLCCSCPVFYVLFSSSFITCFRYFSPNILMCNSCFQGVEKETIDME